MKMPSWGKPEQLARCDKQKQKHSMKLPKKKTEKHFLCFMNSVLMNRCPWSFNNMYRR